MGSSLFVNGLTLDFERPQKQTVDVGATDSNEGTP